MNILSFLILICMCTTILSTPGPQNHDSISKSQNVEFQKTENLAAPPVDLARPVLLLPESIPIKENQQDIRRVKRFNFENNN
ncbi:uncharacterized protein LOC119679240 [Teleopsis dalmanni]|uniref:uncharacterized protein LOC119679240 n=1 Tax=Teleopsis dalmanni TaxID=139649 RepID=UPI0018CF7BD4|nr:uncharacterized protein LOC119679240 [Teleopsis dalmanni]